MPTLNPSILLSGATGYLGKHILSQLLQQGYRVFVIVRRKKENARSRVINALGCFAPVPEKNLVVIEGDLTQPDCGIDLLGLNKLSENGISAVIHSAGLTRFDAHLADDIYLANLQGTKNVYALARNLGIKNFHHLSTAYVAGDTRRTFTSEDLDVGQKFNNPYEASKYKAEKYLCETCRADAINVAIYRPSVIVGGYPLGENNVVSTVYTFMKALHFIRECCRRDVERGRGSFSSCGVRQDDEALFIPLRIAADHELSINLVTVNHVVNQIVKGLKKAIPGYSVTSLLGKDFTLDKLRSAICSALGVKGITYVDNSAFDESPRTVIEEKFYRATSSYQPYLLAAPVFDEHEKNRNMEIDIEKISIEFNELIEIKKALKQRGDLNRLALNTLGVLGAHDYFHRFINGQLGDSFLKHIAYVDTKIRFLINGSRVFDHVIHFNKGKISFTNGSDFDCCYELNQHIFNEIISGKTDIRNAFFDGKIKIKGDREIALKFGFLFNDHFLKIDERIIEEVAGQ